jgi:hypothetical protein
MNMRRRLPVRTLVHRLLFVALVAVVALALVAVGHQRASASPTVATTEFDSGTGSVARLLSELLGKGTESESVRSEVPVATQPYREDDDGDDHLRAALDTAVAEAPAAGGAAGERAARDRVAGLCAALAQRGDDRYVPAPYRALQEVMRGEVYVDLCAFFCGVNASLASGGRVPPPLAVHMYPVDHACFAGDGTADLPADYHLYAFKALHLSALILERQLPNTVHAASTPASADVHWIPNYYDHRIKLPGNAESPMVLAAKLACLAATEPLYQRSQGADHIATLTNDYGACLTRQWYLPPDLGLASPLLHAVSLAVFNGETESGGTCFRPARDIVLPPMVPFAYLPDSDCLFEHGPTPPAPASSGTPNASMAAAGADTPTSSCRTRLGDSAAHDSGRATRLAFMTGRVCWRADPHCKWYSRGVRQRLHAAFGRNGTHATTPATAPADAVVFAQRTFAPETFLQLLRTSEFCLCAPGYGLWTPRPMEAVWAGCIPVLLGLEHYVPPFADLIDWTRFSVAMPAEEIDGAQVLARLHAIPTVERVRMRALIARIHHIFRFRPTGHRPGHDALDLLVFQLWRRVKHNGSLAGHPQDPTTPSSTTG